MKFFVNFLSAFRIAAAFAIIPALLYQKFWLAFILFVLASISDFFDGWLAKKFKVTSKLGGVMDHIGDKLLIANTFIMLSVMMPVWFVIVPVIIMIARELYISGLREFLGTQKIEMPVPKARLSMGKIKTTLQMISGAGWLLLFAVGAGLSAETVTATHLRLMDLSSNVGIYGMWVSLVASLWSATTYTFTFAKKLKQIKK